MNKSLKILLGLATLWPFVYVVIFFLFVFSSVFFMSGPEPQSAGAAVPFVLFLRFTY